MAELRISGDFADVDLDVVHGFLSRDAYWCRGITRDRVERAARHSLCFSALLDGAQVGFARVVTDRATFGYLADVFVLPAHRGQGTDVLSLPPGRGKLPAGRSIEQTGRTGMPDQKPPAIRAEQEPEYRFGQGFANQRLHQNTSLTVPEASSQ